MCNGHGLCQLLLQLRHLLLQLPALSARSGGSGCRLLLQPPGLLNLLTHRLMILNLKAGCLGRTWLAAAAAATIAGATAELLLLLLLLGPGQLPLEKFAPVLRLAQRRLHACSSRSSAAGVAIRHPIPIQD